MSPLQPDRHRILVFHNSQNHEKIPRNVNLVMYFYLYMNLHLNTLKTEVKNDRNESNSSPAIPMIVPITTDRR